MKFIKWFVCVALIFAMPQEGFCQIGRAAKEAATKAVSKKSGKKAGKEASEAIAEKAARELAEDTATKAATSNVSKAVAKKDIKSTVSKKAGRISKDGVERTLRRDVEKTTGKKFVRKSAAETGEKMGKSAIYTSEGKVIREGSAKEAKEVFETDVKKGIQEREQDLAAKQAAAKSGKKYSGNEALSLLDDDPALKQDIIGLEEKLGPLFSTENLMIKKSGSSCIIEFPGTNTKMLMKGNDIITDAGSTVQNGALNEFLNHPLPNKTYYVDGGCSKFVTDDQGKTIISECHSSELYKRVSRGELPAQNKTPLVVSKGGTQGIHDSGHIQQHSTGGQNESINLLPMKASLQRGGAWAKLEKMERDAIAEGCDVWSKKKIVYNDNGSFNIFIELIIDGKVTKRSFTNLF